MKDAGRWSLMIRNLAAYRDFDVTANYPGLLRTRTSKESFYCN